jgi:membrane protease YdiL (CAAX protease family)
MLTNLLIYVPVLGIALMAQWGDRDERVRWATYGLLLLADGIILLVGVLAVGVALLPLPEAGLATDTGVEEANWLKFGWRLLATGVIAPVLLLPRVRRGLGRLIPIDSTSVVHATALVLAVQLIGLTLSQLPLGGGLEGLASSSLEIGFFELLLPLLPFGLLALVGVGYLVRRDWPQTRHRLGVERLTWRQVGLAAGLAVGIVAIYYGVDWVWRTVAPANYALMEQVGDVLYGGVTAPWQAVLVSLTAGVMEELLFRGAVQPRFGILLTSILFTAAHVQFGLTPATLEIFAAALVLGWLRRRHNTSACMLLHFLYNVLALGVFPLLP